MKKLSVLLIAGAIVFSLLSLFGCGYKTEAIQAAESFATSRFYKDMGFAADKIDSKVIYHDTDYSGSAVTLVAVKCYISNSPMGSYCVYCKNGMKINSTEMLPSGYNFDRNLADLKALFGIID